MIFSSERDKLREMFYQAWTKHLSGEPLEPLETQVVNVIREHPEYHIILSNKDKYLDKDYLPENGETNPFFHMSLHMSLRDQLRQDRPSGIHALYQQLLVKVKEPHEVEHLMCDKLMEALWQASRHGGMPDESKYLESLKALLHT